MLRLQNLLKNTVWQGSENFKKESFRFLAEDTGAFDILKHLQTVCNQKGLGAPEVFADESYPDVNIVAEYIEGRLDDSKLAEQYEGICLQSDQLLAELSICYKLAVGSNEIPILVPRNCRHRLYYLDSPKNKNEKYENDLLFSFSDQKRKDDGDNRYNCNYNKGKTPINNWRNIFLDTSPSFSSDGIRNSDKSDYEGHWGIGTSLSELSSEIKKSSYDSRENPNDNSRFKTDYETQNRGVAFRSRISASQKNSKENQQFSSESSATLGASSSEKKENLISREEIVDDPKLSVQKGLFKSFWKIGKGYPLFRGLFFFIMIISALFVYQLPVGKNGSILPGGNLIKSFFGKIPPVFDDITVHISGTPQLSDDLKNQSGRDGFFDKSVRRSLKKMPDGKEASSKDLSKLREESEVAVSAQEQGAVKIAVASGTKGTKTFISEANFIIPPKNNAVFSKQKDRNK